VSQVLDNSSRAVVQSGQWGEGGQYVIYGSSVVKVSSTGYRVVTQRGVKFGPRYRGVNRTKNRGRAGSMEAYLTVLPIPSSS
jgi:hypothetical protein